MAGRQQLHTGPLEAVPAGGGSSAVLSFVPVPGAATVETAGLVGAGVAGAVVVMATTGEVTDTTNTDTAGVAGAGLALLSAVVATSQETAMGRADVASAGAGEAGSGGALAACGALGTDVGSGGVSRPGPILTASEVTATFCLSSSLSEATREAFLDTHTFQAHGEAGPRVFSGPWFRPSWPSPRPVSTGELHLGPDSEQQKGWKSVNLAQPFSSRAEVLGALAAHTLEPTSIATPGAEAVGLTGSSNTVHVPSEPLSVRGTSFWAAAGEAPTRAAPASASSPSRPPRARPFSEA